MLKPIINHTHHIIRWILPLVVLLLIALYLVLSPGLFTHAAAPATNHNVVVPHATKPEVVPETPDMYWPLP
jgi:hypothetical protein